MFKAQTSNHNISLTLRTNPRPDRSGTAVPDYSTDSGATSDIDIWLTFYNEIEPSVLMALRPLLDPEELAAEHRFRFAEDRKCYLVTRALVRQILSRYATTAPADWSFSTNEFGKPTLANPQSDAAGLSFNISHTRGLIVLGISRHRELGVDVEHALARQAPLEVADQYFAPAELRELNKVEEQSRHERFFEYWTLKESYLKARGTGLAIPTDQFCITLAGPCSAQISIAPGLHDDAGRWLLLQCRPTPEHVLAICAERQVAHSPIVTVRKVIPGVSEVLWDVTWLRWSDESAWQAREAATPDSPLRVPHA